MTKPTCTVPECDRPRFGHGLCNMHYSRQRRHGSIGEAEPLRQRGRVGCAVDGCASPNKSNGYCGRHLQNIRRTGNPFGKGPLLGEQSPHWVEAPTYHGVHSRLRSQRGAAKNYRCPCGDRARHWAYNHTDPDQQWEEVGGYMLPYSTNLALYDALCIQCHRRRDVSYQPIGVLR